MGGRGAGEKILRGVSGDRNEGTGFIKRKNMGQGRNVARIFIHIRS